jgi:hypothetical protein
MRKRILRSSILISAVFLSTGCGRIIGFDPYDPATPLTAAEWAAVNEIEARFPAAVQKFGPGFKVRPRIHVVRSPDQVVDAGFYGKRVWKDLPAALAVEEAVPGEGVSGWWNAPDLYVSVVNGRNFRLIYAHERAHTFFERGGGSATHNDPRFKAIEKFLLGEG